MLKKISAQLAAKALVTAAAAAAVTVAVAPSASAAATSVAWGSTMSQAQFTAQGQCFDWGYQHASDATYSWDDSRNKWKATVQCW